MHLTYLRSYVNNMLKKHPHGEKFKEIRDLARYVETYVPPIPDPDEEEETRAQKITKSILGSMLTLAITGGGGPSRGDIKRENLPNCYEQLNQKLSELMDIIDCSKDSIWLATYMIEEGAPGCPLAVSVFEKYLEKCT